MSYAEQISFATDHGVTDVDSFNETVTAWEDLVGPISERDRSGWYDAMGLD